MKITVPGMIIFTEKKKSEKALLFLENWG